MPKPINFCCANHEIEEASNGEVSKVFHRDGVTISCWKFTPEEIQEIIETGVVWAITIAPTMPTIGLNSKPPVHGDGQPFHVVDKAKMN